MESFRAWGNIHGKVVLNFKDTLIATIFNKGVWNTEMGIAIKALFWIINTIIKGCISLRIKKELLDGGLRILKMENFHISIKIILDSKENSGIWVRRFRNN